MLWSKGGTILKLPTGVYQMVRQIQVQVTQSQAGNERSFSCLCWWFIRIIWAAGRKRLDKQTTWTRNWEHFGRTRRCYYSATAKTMDTASKACEEWNSFSPSGGASYFLCCTAPSFTAWHSTPTPSFAESIGTGTAESAVFATFQSSSDATASDCRIPGGV